MTTPAKPGKSHIPFQKSIILLPIPLCLLFVLFYLFTHHKAPKQCSHILLFTEARHGSTWLLDSVEHCRFSRLEQVQPGIYGERVYLDTELWHIHEAPLQNITIDMVEQYLVHNCSLKIFPTTLQRKEHDVRMLLQRLRSLDIPIVVLRRDLRDAWKSLKEAERTGQWANVLNQRNDSTGVPDVVLGGEDWEHWLFHTKNFFAELVRVLRDEGVAVDWLWYENVKDLPWVKLRAGRCFVRNCNFL